MLTEGEVSLTGHGAAAYRRWQLPFRAASTAAGATPRLCISKPRWLLLLAAADAVTALLAIQLATVVRFGVSGRLGPSVTYPVLLITWPLVCPLLLWLAGAYNQRRLATGPSEFGRVAQAGLLLLVLLVFGSYITHADLSREVVAVAVGLTTALILAVHLLFRYILRRRILRGRALDRVLVVGFRHDVRSLVDHIERLPHSGVRVCGVCIPEGDMDGTADEMISAARAVNANVIAIAGSNVMEGQELRRLSWDLEDTGLRLLVVPGVTELAGPRLQVQLVGGLPMLHVREAEFSGAAWVLKSLIDRAGAGFCCLALAPVLLAIAVAVRCSSKGPVLFRQERVGLHGRPFELLKFRTMHDGAEQAVDSLSAFNEHDGALFKIRRDPRITSVGRFLRRYSLDELPQLWNVLTGSMSLVGPRPPLPREVEEYPRDLRRRRLLVKPGMTGLWQVSGRSDLSWEETIRIDMQYVETWSVLLDAAVMWRTFRAVVSGKGAY
jgi:exopolysaccharide biosynthesis polyprenyl glycosylphosphotransferase